MSSAEKVFLDQDYSGSFEIETLTGLKGERVSYQLVYTNEEIKRFYVRAENNSEIKVTLRNVKSVPVKHPGNRKDMDDFYIRKTAGLYPDILAPLENDLVVATDSSHSLYVTCEIPEDAKAGKYSIKIIFEPENRADKETYEKEITLDVLDAVLPKQDVTYTQWFHSDCIASVYGYELDSDAHWQMIEKFIETAARIGINMILTPVFTLALDTEIGKERPTFQLVEVSYNQGKYSFGFEKLKRWIDICLKYGIDKFEISHLFTQWGAKNTPKIIVNGEKKFGWHTDAMDKEYLEFLGSFLTALKEFLVAEGVFENTFFHISDEPNYERDFEQYKKCYDFVVNYVSEEKLTDAISEKEFIEKGYAKKPVVITEKAAELFGKDIDMWIYYCCLPAGNFYSNKFIAMPLGRARIMGMQLYKYDIKGFLHWGYNFYYSGGSKKVINPFQDTDADEHFPAGDAFSVYPGADGPYESLRSEAFYQGLQDNRACRLLESLIGRNETLKVIDEDINITLTDYPRNSDGIVAIRDRINCKISEVLANG